MAGLGVYESAYRTLERAYGDRFSAPEALTVMVKDGNVELKRDHGFLDIDTTDQAALLAYRDNAYARLSQLRAALGEALGL